MRKFKVGDRVKYVGGVYQHPHIGEVMRVLENVEWPYNVSSDSGFGIWPCSEDELELVEVSDE